MKGIKEESISSVLGLLGLGVEELASSSRPCSKRLNGTWDLSSWGYSDNGIQELNQISKGTGCERKEKAFEHFAPLPARKLLRVSATAFANVRSGSSKFGRVAFAPYFPRTMEPSSERGERFVCLFQLARQSLGQKNHPVFPMKDKVQVSRCHTKGKLSRRYQPLFPNPRCGATQVTRQREVRCFISPRDIMLDR